MRIGVLAIRIFFSQLLNEICQFAQVIFISEIYVLPVKILLDFILLFAADVQ